MARLWIFALLRVAVMLSVHPMLAERDAAERRLRDARVCAQRRLIDAAAHEQARIGREVQQVLGRDLGVLAARISRLESKTRRSAPALAGEVHEMAIACGRAIDSSRAISRGLAPPIEREGDLYRIVQEALNNALKHAAARRIRVTLGHHPGGEIELMISDDGVGMATRGRRSGARSAARSGARHRRRVADLRHAPRGMPQWPGGNCAWWTGHADRDDSHRHAPPGRPQLNDARHTRRALTAFAISAASIALGVSLARYGIYSPLTWMPTGIIAALLVRWGWRYWPWVVGGTLLMGALSPQPPFGLALGVLALNSGPIALAAYLEWRGFRRDFARREDVLRFVIAAPLAMTLPPTITLLGLLAADALRDTAGAGAQWLGWWFNSTTAVMLAGPALIAASRDMPATWLRRRRPALALMLATAGFVVAMSLPPGLGLGPWLPPLGVLVAVTSAMTMDLTFTGLLTLAMTAAVALSAGPVAGHEAAALAGSGPGRIWSFCMVLAGLTMIIHALLAERDAADSRLREADALYRQGLLDAAAREQERIGRDVHDALGQELTAISLLARGLETRAANDAPALAQDAQDIVQTCQRAVQSARSIARGLVPAIDHGGDLVDALRLLAQHVPVAASGAEVSIIAGDDLHIPAESARHLYRIAQEALNNALKHSGAKLVRLVISRLRDDAVRMTIADDGVGLDLSAAATSGAAGIGLRTMQYRAEVAGGTLRFESEPGHGTRIVCDIPAKGPAREVRAEQAPVEVGLKALQPAQTPFAAFAATGPGADGRDGRRRPRRAGST
jgi:signal transduction histidine kinase